MKKVVINACYGGFNLSQKATKYLIDKRSELIDVVPVDKYYTRGFGHSRIEKYDEEYEVDTFLTNFLKGGVVYKLNMDTPRDHPDLIEVIEKLGAQESSGRCAALEVIEIPDDVEFTIEKYDGFEHVAEKHRTWR